MDIITDNIDTTLAQYLPAIVLRQQQFYQQTGRFFQGLPSSSVTPQDGAAAVVDAWDSAPTYQGVSWREAWGGDPPVSLTSTMRIDQYQGPIGDGWVLVLEVRIAGQLLRRCLNFGPESWREQPWTAIQPNG